MEYNEESEIPAFVVNSTQNCLSGNSGSIDNILKASEARMNSPKENQPCNFFNVAQNVISVDIEHATNLRITLEPEDENFEIENVPLDITKKIETNVLQISSIILDHSYCSTVFYGYENIPYEEDINYSRLLKLWRINNKELDLKREDLEPSETVYEEIMYSKAEDQLAKVKNDEDSKYDQSLELWGIKHEELDLKEEDLEPSETCISPEEVEILKCYQCGYQTIHKSYLKRHMLRHKNPAEGIVLKCAQCQYRTFRKCDLKTHMLLHNNSEVKILKCDNCDYLTYRKGKLNQHMFRHKNPDDVKVLKCDQCDYRTFRKCNLKQHMFRHKNPNEVKVLKCTQCDYQTIQKSYLYRHMFRHKNPDEVKVLKCNQCDYRTSQKSYLNRHMLRH